MDDVTHLSRPRPLVPPTHKMSFEEFLQEFGSHRTEWLPDGTVEVLQEESMLATQVRLDLAELLGVYLAVTGWGHVLAGYLQRMGDNLPVRNVDLLVVAHERLERVVHTCFLGAADVAIEVVSLESTARDYGLKFREYERGGVREYWLVDPERRNGMIYELGENGVYRLRPPDEQGRLTSGVLERFSFHPDLFWANVPPTNADNLLLVADMLGVPVDSLLK